ncbi:MAG: Ig-like domain-containing protein [Bradymonadia bacterium]
MMRWLSFLVLLAALTGCDDGGGVSTPDWAPFPADVSGPDALVTDGTLPEDPDAEAATDGAVMPDGGDLDMEAPADGDVSDAEIPDAEIADAEVPDADPNAPLLAVTEPQAGAFIATAEFTVSGTARAAMAGDAVTVTLDGVQLPVNDDAFEAVIERPDGPHVLAFVAEANGFETRVDVPITVDTRAPRVVITDPQAGARLIRDVIDLTGTVDEDGVRVQVGDIVADVGPEGFVARGVQLAEGANEIVVVATDQAGNQGTASVQVDVDITPPSIQIDTPEDGTLLQREAIDVSGRVNGEDVVQVEVDGAAVEVAADGTFTRELIPLEEGRNIISAAATDGHGNVAVAQIAVIRDTSPATIRIETPKDGDVLTSTQVDVAGVCNDLITGVTVNEDDLRVWVNGVEAQVLNRTFVLPDLLLQRGPNVITVEAEDRTGNRSSQSIRVRVDDQAGQRIVSLSGNGQRVRVGDETERPLVVSLLDANGNPVANAPVSFAVSRGEGAVVAFPERGREVQVRTDDNGLASVTFAPGRRAGAGSHRVTATAPGYVGKVEFCTSVIAHTAHRISMVKGDAQEGATRAALPDPFVALVVDQWGNPVSGVEVTFEVMQGDGQIVDSPRRVVTTDADGLAMATLTLGGAGLHTVNARFEGLEGDPATFQATALVPGPRDTTRLVGQVLDNEEQPLPNATAWVRLPDGPIISSFADEAGRFLLEGVPVGPVHLVVDGSTTRREGSWPSIQYDLTTVAGVDNTVGRPIFLPRNDLGSARIVGGDADTTLTIDGVPGAEMTVFANSVTCPDGGNTCQLMWSQVRGERVPDPPPLGSNFSLVWTVQPPNVRFDPPARVCIPNEGWPVGQQLEIFSFDHDLADWVGLGTATVTADGTKACTDEGFGLRKSGWGGAPPPPPPPSCVGSCDDGNPCTSDSCQDGNCVHDPIDGGSCDDGSGCSSRECQMGNCVTLEQQEDGTECDDNSMCTEGDTCQGGDCVGEEIECGDENDCTEDTCDPAAGCRNEPRVGAECDDGDLCTENDQCNAEAACEGTTKECEQDENECDEHVCDENTGECTPEPRNEGERCGDEADEDQCGVYECQPDGTCAPPPGEPSTNGQECDDEDICTENDMCQDGECKGEDVESRDWLDRNRLGFELKVPSNVVARCNSFINRIPGLGGVKFKEATVDGRARVKDCCDPDRGIVDLGRKELSARFTLRMKTGDIPIGPWFISIDGMFDFGIARGGIFGDVGPFWDGEFTILGELGRRISECEGDNCFFGSGGGRARLGIKLVLEAFACIGTPLFGDFCRGLTFAPAIIRVEAGARITYNKSSCDSGIGFCGYLGRVIFQFELSLSSPGSNKILFQRQVYDGFGNC